MKRYIFLFLSFFYVFTIIASGQSRLNQAYLDYINQYKGVAIEGMHKYGVPASITLAQGLLESGAGRGRLVLLGNNHFGIKCHGWTGRTISHDDDAKGECFRAYNSALESYEDHCKFLRERSRYQSLFSLDLTDYRGWAFGLKRAGYATNPSYAQTLIRIIELYQLYVYDKMLPSDCNIISDSGKSSMIDFVDNGCPNPVQVSGTHPISKFNDNYFIIVRQGDTFKSLSKELDISVRKLAKYNERDKHDSLIPGEYIWLMKKQKKGPKECKKHPYIVRRSESLYNIAQRYGIRLKSLIKKNEKLFERGLRIGDEVILY